MSIFSKIPSANPHKSHFNLSHEVKLTADMGKLVPILCEEVIPGDKFSVGTELFLRMAPTLAPIMHRVNVYTHFFFVPNRLLMEHKQWEEFITGGERGDSSAQIPFNTTQINMTRSSLADYLGLPMRVSADGTVQNTHYNPGQISLLPFRAYHLIYNEYFRDQWLQDPTPILASEQGYSEAALYQLKNRAWEKDYFTASLPNTQKGPPVTIPINTQAEVKYRSSTKTAQFLRNSFGGDPSTTPDGINTVTHADSNNNSGLSTYSSGNYQRKDIDPNGTLYADVTSENVTINDLRKAFQIQKWLERNARAGSRYIESILSHFGVRSSDARLQRPEFLGGGKSPVVISEVLQTSESSSTPQGTMAGHATSAQANHAFKRHFEEHGYIIGLMSVMPRTAYFQGLHKKFFRADRYDFAWPIFAHLGEQSVMNKELYYDDSDPAFNDATFGYQSRYAEYKFIPSRVAGDFRGNLNYWHMARHFGGQPLLNSEFITANPTTRIWPVTDPNAQHLWIQIYHNIHARRPLPRFGEPGLIDHG